MKTRARKKTKRLAPAKPLPILHLMDAIRRECGICGQPFTDNDDRHIWTKELDVYDREPRMMRRCVNLPLPPRKAQAVRRRDVRGMETSLAISERFMRRADALAMRVRNELCHAHALVVTTFHRGLNASFSVHKFRDAYPHVHVRAVKGHNGGLPTEADDARRMPVRFVLDIDGAYGEEDVLDLLDAILRVKLHKNERKNENEVAAHEPERT